MNIFNILTSLLLMIVSYFFAKATKTFEENKKEKIQQRTILDELQLMMIELKELVYKDKEEQELMKKQVISMQHNNLKEIYKYHERDGFVTTDELYFWNKAYNEYCALGGNGAITKLNDEVQKLPLIATKSR